MVCRYVNADIQKLLPADIQAMFAAATDQSVSEALCVLYVAVTRAVHALHIIVRPSKSSEKKLTKTYAGLLRAALTDQQQAKPDTVLFEHGDPEWFRHSGETLTPIPARPSDTAPLDVRLAPTEERRTRGLDRASPSGLEGGSRVKLADVLATDEGATARERGTLIHAWFEQIEWIEDGRPDEALLRRVAAEHPPLPITVDVLLRQFGEMLDDLMVARTLSRNAYDSLKDLGLADSVASELEGRPLRLEVANERKFAVRDGNTVLSGFIDRLVLIYAGDQLVAADIVDYKSDALPDNDAAALAAKIEHYRPQLAAYRTAVATMTGLDEERISARLLFVGAGIVARV